MKREMDKKKIKIAFPIISLVNSGAKENMPCEKALFGDVETEMGGAKALPAPLHSEAFTCRQIYPFSSSKLAQNCTFG